MNLASAEPTQGPDSTVEVALLIQRTSVLWRRHSPSAHTDRRPGQQQRRVTPNALPRSGASRNPAKIRGKAFISGSGNTELSDLAVHGCP